MFAEITNFSDAHLHALSFLPVRVSIFDHWLTKQIRTFTYAQALKGEHLAEYMAGEDRFVIFYGLLIKAGGAFWIAAASGEPRSIGGAELQCVILASLRDTRLIDLYVERLGTQSSGRFRPN
jgi:hypothetical protein